MKLSNTFVQYQNYHTLFKMLANELQMPGVSIQSCRGSSDSMPILKISIAIHNKYENVLKNFYKYIEGNNLTHICNYASNPDVKYSNAVIVIQNLEDIAYLKTLINRFKLTFSNNAIFLRFEYNIKGLLDIMEKSRDFYDILVKHGVLKDEENNPTNNEQNKPVKEKGS